jgi:hypothetical protein
MTKKPERTERGPMARRGAHFSQQPLPELMEALNRAKATLRLLNCLETPWHREDVEVMKLRELSPTEVKRRRKEIFELQSDLRAELRRRSAI